MARRHAAEKRQAQPDSRYGNPIFGKFINAMMWDGKKSVSEAVFYGSLELLRARVPGRDPCDVFQAALSNVRPSVEVRYRRVGGATYPVPVPVSAGRSQALAIRWLLTAARARPEKTMVERLALEISNAAEETGASFKKKTDTHRMAAANQAFAHYRW